MTGYEQIPGLVLTILRLNQVLISYVRLLEVEQLICHQDIFQLGHLTTYTRIYMNIYPHIQLFAYIPTSIYINIFPQIHLSTRA